MKRKNVVASVAGVVVVALLCGGLAGCTTDDAKASSTKKVEVSGWAYAGAPLEDAVLTISTADGKTVVRSQKKATSSHGTFSETAQVPEDYRVTVGGGKVGAEIFTGKLVADVVDHGPSSGLIQVNALTTLLAAYRDRHPDLTPEQAQTEVRRFLQLPDGIDVTADLRGLDDRFSSTEFQRQAEAAGGMQRFVTQLVAEMDEHPARTHAFVGAAHNDITSDALKAAAKALAKYGLQKVLEQAGFSPPDKAVVDMLNQLSTQVTVLQASVDEIKQLVSQEIYNSAISPALTIKNLVVNAYANMKFGAEHKDPAKTALALQQANALASQAALTGLHGILMGELGRTGAYKGLSDSLKANGVFWTKAKSDQLVGLFDYFDSVQSQLVMLLGQLAFTNGSPPENFELPDGDLGVYETQRTAQQALRPAVAPTVIDTRTNLMWPVTTGNRADIPWSGQISELDALNGCVVVNGIRITCGVNSLYGFSDWRLPTGGDNKSGSELQMLVQGHVPNPKSWLRSGDSWGASAFVRAKPLTDVVNVWSGTHDANQAVPNHWSMNLDTGALASRPDSSPATLWPVRVAAEKYWL